jgi:hypothetical protein
VLFAEITDCPRCQLRAQPPAPVTQEPEEPAPSQEPIRIFLVGCGKTKQPGRHQARALYSGPVFRAARRYVEQEIQRDQAGASTWSILSAKHGILAPLHLVENYDQRLPGAELDRSRWGQNAATTLRMAHHQRARVEVVILAGADYADAIRSHLPPTWSVSVPLAGLPVGRRLAWFKRSTQS